MSDLREAVARALYEHREGPVANADFSRQQALWHDCTLQAESALKAIEAAGFVVAPREVTRDLQRAVLREAIEWNGEDDFGVPAVWLERARAALERRK